MKDLYCGRGMDSENAALIEFLNDVFFFEDDDDDTRDFLTLLPKIYKDEYRPAYNNFLLRDHKGEYRASVGAFMNYLTIGGEDVSACCIGNVAVGRKYRSKGYMADLLKLTVDELMKIETDVVYLGGQRQRYSYFGFEVSGMMYTYYFNKKNIKHAFKNKPSGLKAFEMEEGDYESARKIDEIYSRLPVRSQRTIERYCDILKSWNSTPFIVTEHGEFAGYFVLNDGGNDILEFGAVSEEYYQRVVTAIFELTDAKGISFSVTPFDKEKIAFFDKYAEGISVRGCESVLVLNYRKIIGSLLKAKTGYETLSDGETVVLIHGFRADEKLKISVRDNQVEVTETDDEPEYELSHNEATRAFFSLMRSDASAFRPEIRQWLPLHLSFHSTDTM